MIGGFTQLNERFSLARERKRRGSRELNRINRSDRVLFSPGNSGRTWIRVMLTRVIERHYELDPCPLVNFDNLHKHDSGIPIIAITHNRWVPYFKKPEQNRECSPYYHSTVLVLVRNPLDTCVSQYFQWKHRSKDRNIQLKGWPPRSCDLSLPEFFRHPETGVERLCRELNIWLRESSKFVDVLFIRYEDMLGDTLGVLRQIVQFLGVPATEAILEDAVEYGSFPNMKKRETGDLAPPGEKGQSPVRNQDGETHKARTGKIGGYSDYLTTQECEFFEKMIATQLSGRFGYANLPQIQEISS